jgi:hypothetical protein
MSDDTVQPTLESMVTAETLGGGETDSRRYWRAAISHLSDPQKRDAAWEFYLRRLEARRSGDTLSALVLLLEANGAFLTSLPEKINAELMNPFDERFATMRSHLVRQEEVQREMVAVLEKAAERNASTNARSIANLGTAESALRKAATSLDAGAVVREVTSQIEEEALLPLKRVLKDLGVSSSNIRDATTAAESAIEKWRRVHLRGVAIGLFTLAAIVSGMIITWSRYEIEHHYEDCFTSAVLQLDTSRGTLSKLAENGIGVRVMRSSDNHGDTIPGSFAVVIDDAEAADVREWDGRRRGVLFVRAAKILPQPARANSLPGKPLTR